MTSPILHTELTSASPGDVKAEQRCLVQEQKYNPQDNPENIISKQAVFFITTLISSGIIPLLFLVGVPGNLLSAAVFYRQGLRERINLCVFSLALVDLVAISADFFIRAEAAYRNFVGSSNFFIKYFPGVTGFTWVSMFLSAVIASERCFCVVSPLRAQRMLSTRTLAAIIIPISLILLAGMLVIAGPKHTEACVFDPQTNTTSFIFYVTEYYLEHTEILDIIDIFVYATTLPIIFFIIVVVTTVITAVKLRSASRWRQQSSSASGAAARPAGSSDDQMVALTRMLIATSVLFVVCVSPILVVQITVFWVAELKNGGRYTNLRSVLWNIVPMFRGINSSLNVIVYYHMGSRFRHTLKLLLACERVKRYNFGSVSVDCSNGSGYSRSTVFSPSANDMVASK